MIYKNIYKIGFFLILILPVLVVPPWIFPPDWGKTIIFRSIFSVLLFILFYDFIYIQKHKISDIFKNLNFKKNIVLWILSSLALLFMLSLIFSKDILFSLWGSPLRGGGAINFLFYIVFSIIAFLIFKERDWQKIWGLSIFIGDLVSIIAVFQFFGLLKNIFIEYSGRPPSVIGGPMFLGTYLLLLSFLTFAFFIKEKNIRLKMFYAGSLVLFLFIMIISGSRATFLGVVIGGLFFLFFYPKKNIILKITAVVLLAIMFIAVYFANYQPKITLAMGDRIYAVSQRLLIDLFLKDPRFSAWQVATRVIQEKPLLGWGPENFAIGFDKYYDPSLPSLSQLWGGWYDRAHNILIDIGATAGIPAALAYLSLFIILLWQLQKNKYKEENSQNRITIHCLQATLVAYFANNFFSFDVFPTYLIFFLLVAYSLFLINKKESAEIPQKIKEKIHAKEIKALPVILFLILLFFLWQYNLKPFLQNINQNIADYFIKDNDCNLAFVKMDKALKSHSFLDSYLRMQYVTFLQKCESIHPENSLAYAQRGIDLLKESVKIQPNYSRSWIFLGAFTTVLANHQEDAVLKNQMLSEAELYLKKAQELAPLHQEIIMEQIKIDLVRQNYQDMKSKSEKCILIDSSYGGCYWMKALAEIYLKNFDIAQEYIKIANEKFYTTDSTASLYQLASAYSASENFEKVSEVYLKLIKINPNIAQYHSSLAFTYAKIGKYNEARQEALEFLELMPQAKDEVEAFLKTLP